MLKLSAQAAAAIVTTMNNMRVLLGMSGGVDSSVAAFLLKEKGYDVLGVTLILTENDNGENARDAKAVSDFLGIPHKTYDLRKDFKKSVTDYFVSEYKEGRTPNPCVACNKKIKFGKMLELADENGCSHIATGHYAKILEKENGAFSLTKASFREKDQTYFLYTLSQNQLSRSIMPLGDFSKPEIRELAEKIGINVARKRDSQDICFIPDGDKNAFLKKYLPEKEGNFVDVNGNVLGKHKGIFHYTVGQRKGLGMAFGKPMFVLSINPLNNTVVLGEAGSEMSESFEISDTNFILPIPENNECMVKVRYSAPEIPCILEKSENGYKVTLKTPARAITPGQAAVFYVGDEVLGGGTIL